MSFDSFRIIKVNGKHHPVIFMRIGYDKFISKDDVKNDDEAVNAYTVIPFVPRGDCTRFGNCTFVRHNKGWTVLGVDTFHFENWNTTIAEKREDAFRQIKIVLKEVYKERMKNG